MSFKESFRQGSTIQKRKCSDKYHLPNYFSQIALVSAYKMIYHIYRNYHT